MRLFKTIAGLQAELRQYWHEQSIGFVPTMGALHEGHLSLIRRAIAENEIVVVSIFINPLQFAPNEDLENYPRSREQDAQLCEELGVRVLFAPSPETMGIARAQTTIIPPPEMTSGLCSSRREGHFQGVATIVTKLFNLVRPTRAYFGEKDAQQLAIIRRLVADLNIPVEIRPCPTVREASGLAYSSRNQYLTPEQKENATVLFRSLEAARGSFQKGERNAQTLMTAAKTELQTVPEVELEYLELVDPQTLIPLNSIETSGLLAIAARVGTTRLIDNIQLRSREPIIAIDGPAGAGKSTVTRLVAEALGFLYLDTGAMYRAIAWLVLEKEIALDDEPAIAECLESTTLTLRRTNSTPPLQVSIDNTDVTQAIRTPQVSANVSAVAKLSAVRQVLLKQQQQWGEKGGIVAEGRDIGTHVFPNAELKIFLTASAQERARRRLQDLAHQGETQIDLEQMEKEIQHRDYIDSTRKIAPLCKAPDAIELVTDGLSIEEVTQTILKLYARHYTTF
ncbi:bifunctional pantoate--beta-alanine ligase/(d)CMP kinase [Lusitaniella coriacea]|uniref:bifunctional pantoate--beta-alanine ligase/(d)CMP kinase n=1 Tax=Lusitaniella coriacea TaxID=1983105 RepID=UPI003CF1B8BE